MKAHKTAQMALMTVLRGDKMDFKTTQTLTDPTFLTVLSLTLK